MKIVNKTPHEVHIVNRQGERIKTFPMEGDPIRLKAEVHDVEGNLRREVPITYTVYAGGDSLPPYVEGVWYIVSQLVLSAFPDRTDLLVPAEVVRDAGGNIVGCRSLGCNQSALWEIPIECYSCGGKYTNKQCVEEFRWKHRDCPHCGAC